MNNMGIIKLLFLQVNDTFSIKKKISIPLFEIVSKLNTMCIKLFFALIKV